MKGAFIGLWLLVQGLALGSPAPSSHIDHESQDHTIEHSWIKRSRVIKNVVLPVRIGLAQKNLDLGHDLLMQISDPTSKQFGRHYSAEEVVELFAPSQKSIAAVRAWLQSSGIPGHRISISDNRQWLQFDAQASELESLLYTEYYHYDHDSDGSQAIACERYHLPKAVQSHVDFIRPGLLGTFVSYDEHKQSYIDRTTTSEDEDDADPEEVVPRNIQQPGTHSKNHGCGDVTTPACIRKLYNITDTIKKVPENTVGIFSTQNSYYNDTDLDLFFKTYAKEIKQGTRPKTKLIAGAHKNGPRVDVSGGSELDLDIQVIYPWVYPNEVLNFEVYDHYYQFYKHTPLGLFNVFLDAIDGSYCNTTAFGITGNSPKYDGQFPNPHKGGYKGQLQCGIFKPPKVLSFSYVSSEERLPVPYQRRACQEYMKLGLQGVSFIFGSGDAGVATRNCKKSSKGDFQVTSPRCPYVTVVGATRIPEGAPARPGVEHAAAIPAFRVSDLEFYSGGGFSNLFPRPAYQDEAVENYFKKHNPPYRYYETNYTQGRPQNSTGRYNRIGRGFPDVAAIGQRTANVFGQKKRVGFGTSASTPLFAGLISRINNHRISAGKSAIGFLNPSMYHNPGMFNDVIEGHNPGCQPSQKGYNDGFRCAPGWDPVTGLGTPNYGKMLEYYMSLP